MSEEFGWSSQEFPKETTEYPSSPRVKTLYLYRLGDRCISHDGYIQIGIFSHSLERHIELNPKVNWIETYWCPDIFKNRYKRATLQKTSKANEGSPKTDNEGLSLTLETKPIGCNKLEDK